MTEADQPDSITAGRQEAIGRLYAEYAEISTLAPLARSGRRLVPGHGLVTAPLVIVGEAPAGEEERLGEPFIGPSGQLLRDLLKDAGVAWDWCYVTNTVPWRMPNDRKPYPFEIMASCRRVQQEAAVLEPRVIIAAGAVAFQALTSKKRGAPWQARSKWMTWTPDGADAPAAELLTIWHPSAILREPRPPKRAEMEAETRAALASILTGDRVAV
jgi:uracil-DNA glycosylase family 4